MKILLAHNSYQDPGGEDEVFRLEKELLERKGHAVHLVTRSNKDDATGSRLRVAANAIWSRKSLRAIEETIVENDIEIAHFHNTHLMLSPSAYAGCKRRGIPVVHTLHNYRLVCPGGLLYRNGEPSEECLGKKVPLRGIINGCYRDSASQTFVTFAAQALQRSMATRQGKVDAFITLSEFAREQFLRAGIPGDLLVTKPNFVHPDPGPGSGQAGFFLFVGRLVPEKGLGTLLEAWRRLEDVPLKIVGAGPLSDLAAAASEASRCIEFLGSMSNRSTLELMKDATGVVVPSEWPEPFGRVVIESFAVGTPVIASDRGGLSELVDDGRTGFLFRAANPSSLSSAVHALKDHADAGTMRAACRREFEDRYTADRNYEVLMSVYRDAIRKNRAGF